MLTLLRALQRDGMPCGEVEHAFTAGGGTAILLFCRTATEPEGGLLTPALWRTCASPQATSAAPDGGLTR